MNRPRFLAASLLAAPGGAWGVGSGIGGFGSGACEELVEGDQGVTVGTRAARAEAGGESVAVVAALLAEVAGLAVGAGVDGAGASGLRWGRRSGRVGRWGGVAASVGGLPAGLVAVGLPAPRSGQGGVAGQADLRRGVHPFDSIVTRSSRDGVGAGARAQAAAVLPSGWDWLA